MAAEPCDDVRAVPTAESVNDAVLVCAARAVPVAARLNAADPASGVALLPAAFSVNDAVPVTGVDGVPDAASDSDAEPALEPVTRPEFRLAPSVIDASPLRSSSE